MSINISPDISLVDALKISIQRMAANFNQHWVIADKGRYGAANDCIGSKGKADSDYERIFEPDNHPFTEICICLKGTFAIEFDKLLIDVNEGDVCLVLPGVTHSELPKKNHEYIAVWMSLDFRKSMLHLSGKDRQKAFFTLDGYSLKPDYEYMHTLNDIKTEIDKYTELSCEIIKTYIIQLFVSVWREISNKAGRKNGSNPWKESVVLDVQKFVLSNYSKHLRLDDVSQAMCISANYLNTIFKSITGKTIMQYADEVRIDRAKYLLLHTELSINSISIELGYYDQYHFSNIFKKSTGVSPSKFRKSHIYFPSS